MKVIDVHLHFSKCDGFDQIALAAGHENSPEHLARTFEENDIVLAIAMGEMGGVRLEGVCSPRSPNLAGTVKPGEKYPHPPFIAYCAGVESREIVPETTPRSIAEFERHLRTPECVGIKLYPGYNACYLNDPVHYPYYELAERYDVPVVIHTGELAGTRGLLKYSHPLTVDEVAANFPNVRFVMAHYGNPWIVDATAVAAKNPNVYLDLSGLAEGNFTADWFWSHFKGQMEFTRMWLTYLNNWDKVLYGSDWPLVNIPAYLEVIRRLVPEEFQEKVFFENACRVFPKVNALLSNAGKTTL